MQAWLNFLRWLRSALGLRAKTVSPIKIIEHYHGPNISVLQLQDPSIPGCVSLWRIDRQSEGVKFFVCVINIATFREELGKMGNERSRSNARGGLAASLWGQISKQTNVLATHYWITGWEREFAGTDIQGRYYRSSRISDVNLLAVDLQGTAASFAGDRYARRYAREVVKRLAANEFRELSHHRSWVAAVESIDWAGWLEGLCKSSRGGISAEHVLQPRSAR